MTARTATTAAATNPPPKNHLLETLLAMRLKLLATGQTEQAQAVELDINTLTRKAPHDRKRHSHAGQHG